MRQLFPEPYFYRYRRKLQGVVHRWTVWADGVDLVQTTVLLVCFTVPNAGNNSAESIGITEAANLWCGRELDVLQKKLIECAERHEDYEEIAQEIFRLREQKEQALRGNVSQQEQKDRMRELQEFLAAQPHHITEFDETLVRHLLAKVTVSSDRLDFTFQSGVTVSIEK